MRQTCGTLLAWRLLIGWRLKGMRGLKSGHGDRAEQKIGVQFHTFTQELRAKAMSHGLAALYSCIALLFAIYRAAKLHDLLRNCLLRVD
jgi:hypothetical protein